MNPLTQITKDIQKKKSIVSGISPPEGQHLAKKHSYIIDTNQPPTPNKVVVETKIKVCIDMPNFKLLQAKRRKSCPILVIAPSNPNKFNIYDKEHLPKTMADKLKKKHSLIPPAYYTY